MKMPTPVAARWPTIPGSHQYCGCLGCNRETIIPPMEPLYTEDQLKQVRRDALEEAAHTINTLMPDADRGDCADAIRAMKEQIK